MDDSVANRAGPSAEVAESDGSTPMVQPFGADLGRALERVCEGRLTELRWFRTDWQRGGALTGYADYTDARGETWSAVAKLPVAPVELRWLRRLQVPAGGATRPNGHIDHADAPSMPPNGRADEGEPQLTDLECPEVVPRLLAGGEQVNGYDFAWVVMERLPHGPLDSTWQGGEWPLIADAAARFYRRASMHPIDRPPRQEDWRQIISRARTRIREHKPLEPQRWNKALKSLGRGLKKLLRTWEQRPVADWCHGDLHLRNAMTRGTDPDRPALLFDLAQVHPGHWVEDAVYLEHLYWAAPRRLGDCDIVKRIARARKGYGLAVDSHWPRLADIRRCLIAAAAPAYMRNEGDPAHLAAALNTLESVLHRLGLARGN